MSAIDDIRNLREATGCSLGEAKKQLQGNKEPSWVGALCAKRGLEFFEHVADGRIYAGMPEAEVLELLGEPDDKGGTSRKYRKPCVWKYGDVEIGFHRPDFEVCMVYVDDGVEGVTMPQFFIDHRDWPDD